jgi:hypothetical protein
VLPAEAALGVAANREVQLVVADNCVGAELPGDPPLCLSMR